MFKSKSKLLLIRIIVIAGLFASALSAFLYLNSLYTGEDGAAFKTYWISQSLPTRTLETGYGKLVWSYDSTLPQKPVLTNAMYYPGDSREGWSVQQTYMGGLFTLGENYTHFYSETSWSRTSSTSIDLKMLLGLELVIAVSSLCWRSVRQAIRWWFELIAIVLRRQPLAQGFPVIRKEIGKQEKT